MHSVRIAAVLLRLSVLNELQYRVNFFVYLFQSLLAMGTGLVVVALVFDNVDALNGWSRGELLVVLGVYTLLGGIIGAVIQPNMLRLMADVQDGTFDFVLTKPVDIQLFVSLRQIQVWKSVDVVTGLVLVAAGLARLDEAMTVGRIVGFIAMLGTGTVLVYCVWLVITSMSFKLVRMDEVGRVLDGVSQAGRWPVGVYPGWLRAGLTFLVPVGFAVTVPAEALTGRLDWGTVVLAVSFATLVGLTTRWYFRRTLRHYSGASA